MSRNYDHLSHQELISLLLARDRRDATKFGLVWEANEIERDKALNGDFVALDLNSSLSCGDAPWKNLIIEGDNFDALRYLNMTFKGRVKCIYIDPPYNTGNKDFVYNDHFVEKEDLWRHSTWCEFMYQRLTLAKDLLREDGVIFVSIDDNEVAPLRLLMDQVFNQNNFIAQFEWQKAYSPRMDAKIVSWDNDHIIAFGRSSSAGLNRLRFNQDATQFTNVDPETGRGYRRRQWRKEGSGARRVDRPNLFYPLTAPDGETIFPIRPDGTDGRWRGQQSYFEELVGNGEIEWVRQTSGWQIYVKQFADSEATRPPSTWWSAEEYGHNHEAAEEIREILGAQAFSTPKPTRLIERILQIATKPDDLILDFFAGSGTTAHAVAKLNKADGGNRRFILVSSTEATAENPDKNLCRDVCSERVRRVIMGYKNAKGEAVEGLGGDFAYLRTRTIPPSAILDIEHEQVWTALQLIHRPTLTPYTEQPFLIAEDEEGALIYVPSFEKELIPGLRETVNRYSSVIVYSWQPGLLRQHLRSSHVQHEAIPESLLRRFGLKS